MFPIVDGLDLGELLNEATYHIEQTEIYTGDQELELSLESSEQALRKLVQLYALMQQLEKEKTKGQGQGQPSKSAGKEGEQKEEELQEADKDPKEYPLIDGLTLDSIEYPKVDYLMNPILSTRSFNQIYGWYESGKTIFGLAV